MTLETKDHLNKDTLEKVQSLIRANIDSSKGFTESAGEVNDGILKELFSEMASQRNHLAEELQTVVEYNHKDAEDDGTFAGKAHRIWVDIRAKLNSGDPEVILIEAERGEDHIKHAYEEVLKETAGSAVNDVLTRQYAKIKKGHDNIRDLRDSYKDA